jgi:hypothetical protein
MNGTRAAIMALGLVMSPGFALAQTAQCCDGSLSNSAHFQGTCSAHGGVKAWVNTEMERQANDWCDDNPDLCADSHWPGIQGHGYHPVEGDWVCRRDPPNQGGDQSLRSGFDPGGIILRGGR